MNIFTEHTKMTNAQLHDYHMRVQARRDFWLAVPIVVGVVGILFFCLTGWSTYPQVMLNAGSGYHVSTEFFHIFTWILFVVLTPFLPLERTERKFAAPILMGAYVFVLLLFGIIEIAGILMALYYVGAVIALEPIRRELEFLRSHPRFPFLERFDQDDLVEQKVAEYYTSELPEYPARPQKNKDGSSVQTGPRAYDPSMTEEVLATLPKKHIEEVHITRGYFDEPEQTYTDDLVNQPENIDRLSRKENFEEPTQGFNDKVIS